MIGLCFEGDTPCSSCSKPLPLNALVESIVCTDCQTVNKLSVENWKDLLENMFQSGPNFQENEGQNSTLIGSRTYSIQFGRQNPKFLDTKTYMDMEHAIAGLQTGKVINPETQVAYSIRKVPEKFADACPHVHYLVGEDFTLLPNYSGSSVLEKSKRELVPFTCPNCGGTLQIDGSERLLKCQHCSSESYIPDETWQKLNPAKPRQRFYFWYDEKTVKFEWDSDLNDCIADEEGTLYMSVDPLFGSDDGLWVVALNPDLTTKWKRSDLKFKTNTGGGEAKLGITSRGELMIWSWDRSAMLLLSCKDGSEVKKIGTKNEDEDKTLATVFDFKLLRYITATPDGKYFVSAARNRSSGDSGSYCEFLVLDENANISLPWNSGESSKKGFFGSLKKAFSGMGDVPYFEKLKSQPTRCKDYDIKLSSGTDGSIYMRSYEDIMKFDKNGNQVYYKKIEGGYIRHKLVGDAKGNAYFLLNENKKDTTVLLKISPDGSSITPMIKGVLDGGNLCDEDYLAIGGNGMFYCAGYGGRIKVFNPDGSLVYASPRSLEDAQDKIKEKEEMED